MSNILANIAKQVESGELVAEQEQNRNGMTAYAVTGLLNQAIDAFHLVNSNGEPHPHVASQYVYNLARSGQIDGLKGGVTGRKFSEEDVTAFVQKWVARRLPETMPAKLDEPDGTETDEFEDDENQTDAK